VLELLADGPHEDWAQYNLRREKQYTERPEAGKHRQKPGEYSTKFSADRDAGRR
jgi:hypothetical protein